MDVQKTACRKSAVGRLVREGIRGTYADPAVSVLNTLKSMIGDEDVLEKNDMYILESVKKFVSTPEVIETQAAKQIFALMERLVRTRHSCFIVKC